MGRDPRVPLQRKGQRDEGRQSQQEPVLLLRRSGRAQVVVQRKVVCTQGSLWQYNEGEEDIVWLEIRSFLDVEVPVNVYDPSQRKILSRDR